MFVSRSSQRSGGTTSRLVLVELDHKNRLDKPVLPALLEFIIQDVTSARTTFEDSGQPDVSFLCLDRDPSDFDTLYRRCSIPASSVIDGYSEWFSVGHDLALGDSTSSSGAHRSIHIGDADPSSQGKGSILGELVAALKASERQNSTEKIVVIDSLSTIMELYPNIIHVLDIKDGLLSAGKELNPKCSMTLICTFQLGAEHGPEFYAIKKIADTFITAHQGTGMKKDSSRLQRSSRDLIGLSICRVRDSGRGQFEDLTIQIDWNKCKVRAWGPSGETPDGEHSSVSHAEKERQYQESVLEDLGLSFRVGLSTAEKELRANAGLPYIHRNEALADSALELHPRELQVGYQPGMDEDDESQSDSDDELFSEDV